MNPDEHPLIAGTRTSVWQKVGYVVVVLGVAAAFAALGIALSAKDESGEVAERVDLAQPCVDANGAKIGVELSKGCRVLFRNLARLCARDPGFCRRSQKLAVKEAQNRSADRQIGPTAQLGGGGSGNKPQSPTAPSPDDPGGGRPEPPPGPQRPSTGPPPSADGPSVPPTGPEVPDPQLPGLVDQVVDGVQELVDPLVPKLP